jgi:hypothetical protein
MNRATIGHVLALAAGTLMTGAVAKFALERAFGWSLEELKARRRIRVTMHRAGFAASRREAFFLTVTNLSASRDIEVSHVWIETEPKVFFFRSDRPLPHRLKPDESWETWVFPDELPHMSREKVLQLGRVRLSTGAVVKSRPNLSVPESGYVPGGPIDRRD